MDYWIESLVVLHTFEALRDFILADQFMASVSTDLRLFLKKNDARLLKSMVKFADNWSTAHNAYPREKSPMFSQISGSVPENHVADRDREMSNKHSHSPLGVQSSMNRRKIKCYSCGQFGHIRSQCPQNPSSLPQSSADYHKVDFSLSDHLSSKFTRCGTVNGSFVSTILRDTGCSRVIVSENVIPDADTSHSRRVTI